MIPKRRQHSPRWLVFPDWPSGFFWWVLFWEILAAISSKSICITLYCCYLKIRWTTLPHWKSIAKMSFSIARRKLKNLFLLAFFALTNVWRFYYAGFTLYTGFSQGLFCSFCMILSGAGGSLQYLLFLLPQSLLLAPVFLLCICHLEELHRNLFTAENAENSKGIFQNAKKRQLLLSKLPFFFICIILLTVGALLEGYLNIPLLKYIWNIPFTQPDSQQSPRNTSFPRALYTIECVVI